MPRDTVSVCSTPRGASARYADCGSIQRLTHINVVQKLVVLNVIPVNAFSTLRGMGARCAGVIPVNVVQVSAAARVASR